MCTPDRLLHEEIATLAQKAVVGNTKPALRRGDGGYADWVIVSIHGLKTHLDLSYRRLLDLLYEMPRIGQLLGLEPFGLPDFSTLCTWMQDLTMPLWREFFWLSAELHETGEIQAIDATGMDRVPASPHYAKWTNYTFKAVKTTALIDCETGALLYIHCSVKQPHDTEIGWQLLKRNLDKVTILTVDKDEAGDSFAKKSV